MSCTSLQSEVSKIRFIVSIAFKVIMVLNLINLLQVQEMLVMLVMLEKQVESTNHGGMLEERMGAEELLISLKLMCSYKILKK